MVKKLLLIIVLLSSSLVVAFLYSSLRKPVAREGKNDHISNDVISKVAGKNINYCDKILGSSEKVVTSYIRLDEPNAHEKIVTSKFYRDGINAKFNYEGEMLELLVNGKLIWKN